MKPAVEVVVCRVNVSEQLRLEPSPLQIVEVPVGAPLVLKALYRLDDLPAFEETTRVWFSSTAGGAGPKPATLNRRDRPFASDAVWGYLPQKHVFRRPGHFEVQFDVRVDQDLHKWSDASFEDHAHAELEGRVTVRVV